MRTRFALLFVFLALAAALIVVLRTSERSGSSPAPPDIATTAPPPPDTGSGQTGRGGTGFGRGGRPTTPIAERFDEVDSALGELVQGRIAFNAPQRMRYGDSGSIGLVASPAMDAESLSTELRRRIGDADPIEVATLQIAPLMEARLEGAPAFDITPLTPVQQPVSRSSPTEWRWTVRALQAGRHQLHLTINAIITVGGERYPRSLDVLNRDIDVDITAAQRVSMFLGTNWQWLLGTVVIPFALWFWNRNRQTSPRRQPRSR